MNILNFGSINIDVVYQVPHFVAPGETLTSLRRDMFFGGKGLNQSIALARAGANVYHAGAVGKADGQPLLDTLEENGVDITYVKREDGGTGMAIIQVDAQGENSILLYPGANRCLNEHQIRATLEYFQAGDMLLIQNEVNGLDVMIETAKERGMQIVLNPSPMEGALLQLPLHLVDTFILNEIEAKQFCPDADDLIDALHEKFPKSQIVLTQGSKGVTYTSADGNTITCKAKTVPVVDTTGAGDTFTGYFLAEQANGQTVKTALEVATKAAAIAITKMGASTSIPTKTQVLEWNF